MIPSKTVTFNYLGLLATFTVRAECYLQLKKPRDKKVLSLLAVLLQKYKY